jgi:hypothetical protein
MTITTGRKKDLVRTSAAPVKVINHPENCFFVAGDYARGDHHLVVGLGRDPPMIVDGHP